MIEIYIEPLRQPELAARIMKEIYSISKGAEFGWDISLMYDEEKYGYKNEVVKILVENRISHSFWSK